MNNTNELAQPFFTAENRLVLFACSVNPDLVDVKRTINEIENWNEATEKLIKKGVAPLFLELLEKHPELVDEDKNTNEDSGSMAYVSKGVPKEVMAKLKQAYLKTLSRSMLLYDAFREIAEKLNAKGIKAVALKGIYLAEHLYPKIGLRQFSDIDLLFREEDTKVVVEIFENLGYKMTEQGYGKTINSLLKSHHLPPMVKNGVSVEIHTKLHKEHKSYVLPEKEMFDRAVHVQIYGQPFHVFEVHDLLIHICLHLDNHLHGGHMQFYSLADIARFIVKWGGIIEWNVLSERCKSYGALNEVINQLLVANKQFGAPKIGAPENGLDITLQRSTLNLIINQLDGKSNGNTSRQPHFYYIRKTKNPLKKTLYILELVFLKKNVMIRTFNIKYPKLYWMWYPYRILLLIRNTFK